MPTWDLEWPTQQLQDFAGHIPTRNEVPWNCLWGCGHHCSISDGQWHPNLWCTSTTTLKCWKRYTQCCFVKNIICGYPNNIILIKIISIWFSWQLKPYYWIERDTSVEEGECRSNDELRKFMSKRVVCWLAIRRCGIGCFIAVWIVVKEIRGTWTSGWLGFQQRD